MLCLNWLSYAVVGGTKSVLRVSKEKTSGVRLAKYVDPIYLTAAPNVDAAIVFEVIEGQFNARRNCMTLLLLGQKVGLTFITVGMDW